MKTKEEILREAYAHIKQHQVPDAEIENILLRAMEEYREQSAWVSVETALPAVGEKVFAYFPTTKKDGFVSTGTVFTETLASITDIHPADILYMIASQWQPLPTHNQE